MLSLAVRQVLYALLTRPPPKSKLKTQIQVDLHVLSILSAFILSQDQTLRSIFSYSSFLLLFLFYTNFMVAFCLFSILLLMSLFISAALSRTRYILPQIIFFVNTFFKKFIKILIFIKKALNKPGFVYVNYLSRIIISYNFKQLTLKAGRATLNLSYLVLLQRGFT